MKTSKIAAFIAAAICPGGLPLILMNEDADERPGDREISRRIKKALFGDTQFKYELIQVEAQAGIVKLSGFVDTLNQKKHATDLAHGIQGVKRVRNRITVGDVWHRHWKPGEIFLNPS